MRLDLWLWFVDLRLADFNSGLDVELEWQDLKLTCYLKVTSSVDHIAL